MLKFENGTMDDPAQSLMNLVEESISKFQTPMDRIYHGVYQPADAIMEQASHALSCHVGCDICCNRLIIVSRLESVTIAEFLIKNNMLDSEPVKKITEHAILLEGFLDFWTDEENLDSLWFEESISCPFQINNVCTIYEARPLICRMRHSLSDPSDCGIPENAAETSEEILEIIPIFEQSIEAIASATGSELQDKGFLTMQLDEILRQNHD